MSIRYTASLAATFWPWICLLFDFTV